ncbi:MAG TPA: hypothetical protein VGK56_05325 [Anaerolineales bacterium]
MFELQFSRRYQWNQKQARWQAAVDQAYARFAQKYPEWSNALFDEHFLAQSATTFLAGQPATTAQDAARVAAAWNQQFGPASPAVSERRIADLTPAAADFLNWTTAAYRAAGQEFAVATPRIA